MSRPAAPPAPPSVTAACMGGVELPAVGCLTDASKALSEQPQQQQLHQPPHRNQRRWPCDPDLCAMDTRSKLAYLCSCLHQRHRSSLAMFQTWTVVSAPTAATQVAADAALGAACDAALVQFRAASCSTPLPFGNGLAPRVARSGAVQVIQSLAIIPPTMHPRKLLSPNEMLHVSEVVYMPLFDCSVSARFPVAVLEAFISSCSSEPCQPADLISFVSCALEELNMSLSSPHAAPVSSSSLQARPSVRRAAEVPADEHATGQARNQRRKAVHPKPVASCHSQAAQGTQVRKHQSSAAPSSSVGAAPSSPASPSNGTSGSTTTCMTLGMQRDHGAGSCISVAYSSLQPHGSNAAASLSMPGIISGFQSAAQPPPLCKPSNVMVRTQSMFRMSACPGLAADSHMDVEQHSHAVAGDPTAHGMQSTC